VSKRIGLGLCCFAIIFLAVSAHRAWSKQGNTGKPGAQSGAPSGTASGDVLFAFEGNAAEIPADFTANIPFLPLRIGQSRPSFFALDSTAGASSIDPSHAAEIHLTAMQPVALNFSGVSMRFAAFPVVARKDFASQTGRGYEGTLGNDFFQQLVVEVDYGRQTVRLYDPATYRYSGQGTVLHLTFLNGVPVVRAKFIEPKGKSLEADFAVDTALDASVVISDRYAEAHRLLRSHWKTVSAVDPELDVSQNVLVGRLREFELGRYDSDNAIATISRANLAWISGEKIAGAIGGGMLARFKVVFDYPHQQMILEPTPHFGDEEEEDKSGISLVAMGNTLKTFEVVNVAPGTPAAGAGLQKGDIIAGIDTDAAADLDLAQVRDLFRQVGHKYNLLIDRGGKTLQITVEMRRLLN
jgi:hypothetical protein